MKPYAAIDMVICGRVSVNSAPSAVPGIQRPTTTAATTASAPKIDPIRMACGAFDLCR